MSALTKEQRNLYIKYAINVALPLAIALVPCTEVYTVQIKLFLASTIFAICAFAMETMPQTGVAIMLPVFWIFFNVAKPAAVFNVFQQYLPWVLLGGFFLANVLQRTGLLVRVVYTIVSKTASTYRGLIIGLSLALLIITQCVGSHPVLYATIAYGICVAFNFGQSRASAGIMFAAACSGMVAIQFRFTNPLILLGTAKAAGYELELLGFFESWWYNIPLILFYVLCIVTILIMFKPEKEINAKEYCKEKLAEMGPMSIQEKKAAAVMLFYLVYIFTQKYHGYSLEWGLAIIPWIMLFPVIGCSEPEDVRKMNFGMVFFVVSCMAIGNVATSLGLGDLLVSIASPILEGQSIYMFFIAMWVVMFICNFAMTPLSIIAAFTVPFIALAETYGIDPLSICYFMRTAFDQVILPYEYANYLLFFGYGVISMKDFIKFMSVKSILNFVIVIGLLIPWWQFTGFLFA